MGGEEIKVSLSQPYITLPVIDVIILSVWMAHFLFFGSSLLISVISYLLTQSAGSQITLMIETESVAGEDESAYDANTNAVQKVLAVNKYLSNILQSNTTALQYMAPLVML